MRVDAHQHFWNYNPVRDTWITPDMHVLRRDYLPGDLEPILACHRFDGCVAIQADQSDAETRFLLRLANEHPFIKGVVGWINLQASNLSEQLAQYRGQEKLKGFRHIVQAEPDGFLLQPDFVRGVATIGRAGYVYDLLVYHHQLPRALAFLERLPEQRIVLDHIGKPGIRKREFEEWANTIRQFASFPEVYCKLSGLVTEAGGQAWKPDDFTPYLEHVVACFGIDRILFGSDWPVCLVAASYATQLDVITRFTEPFSDVDKQKVFGENAERFYNLRP